MVVVLLHTLVLLTGAVTMAAATEAARLRIFERARPYLWATCVAAAVSLGLFALRWANDAATFDAVHALAVAAVMGRLLYLVGPGARSRKVDWEGWAARIRAADRLWQFLLVLWLLSIPLLVREPFGGIRP
jgi:heme/copper-type cytochrome/quinol oxidase subunit 3